MPHMRQRRIDAIFLPDAQDATFNRRPTPDLQVSKRQMPLTGKNTSKLGVNGTLNSC